MDLILRLRRWAYRRPRVLIVDPPGADSLRWAVEAEVDRRGWSLASTPAETDLLVVLGDPGPRLSAAIDVLWAQAAAPRHRLHIRRVSDVGLSLDAAVEALLVTAAGAGAGVEGIDANGLLAERAEPADGDDGSRHADMQHGSPGGMNLAEMNHGAMQHGDDDGMAHGSDHGGMQHGDMGHGDMGHGSDHGGMQHGDMGHGGHEDMGHGGHEDMGHGGQEGMDHSHHGGMSVAGLPMADTAPDRDGLQLDELKVILGPVLPGWPTGLVLRGSVQGDVLTSVDLSWIDDAAPFEEPAEPAPAPVLALDCLARFLLVAGWPTEVVLARRARAGLCSNDPDAAAKARGAAARLAGRVSASRVLAWNVGGMGTLKTSSHEDLPATDVLTRVQMWCAIAAGQECSPPARVDVGDLAAMLEGAEIGTARLIIASVGLPRVARTRAREVADV